MSRRDRNADDVHPTPDDLQDTYGDTDDDADSPFPYSSIPFGWPTNVPGTGPDDDYDPESRGRDTHRQAADEDDRFGEEFIGLVLVAGVVLFVIPEPASSAVGILLLVVGVTAWLVDALR